MQGPPPPIEPRRMRGAALAFALAYLASVGSVVATLGALPDPVASSFGAGGRAQGFMSRTAYGALFVGLAVGLPALLAGALAWLPRRHPRLANIPNRDFWLAPERRAGVLARLERTGFLLGGGAAVFLAVVHALVLRANAHDPPRLANGPFAACVIGFVALTLGVVLRLYAALAATPRASD
jgi:hypothetical protein